MTRLEKCILLKNKGYTYDRYTGKIFGVYGKEITKKSSQGYITLRVTNKQDLFGHHFAWYMIYSHVDFEMLDHKNNVRDDNRIDNLRMVNNQKNMWNKTAKGYTWNKKRKKWSAQIGRNGKVINLGLYNTEEEAKHIYVIAKKICETIYEEM